MNRRYVLAFAFVAVFAMGAWALVQAQQPPGRVAVPEGGQYVVSGAGDSAVLVETRSGKTWVLTRSVQGHSVWLMAQRIDSMEESKQFTELQAALRMEEQRRAEIEKRRPEGDKK